jgi:potassium-transporting ATPase KdpC subunit
VDRTVMPAARMASTSCQDPARVPADAVTASGSGVDPQISPAYADLQVPRIARVTGLSEATVRGLVADATQEPRWGFLGDPAVNVPRLNLAVADATGGSGR